IGYKQLLLRTQSNAVGCPQAIVYPFKSAVPADLDRPAPVWMLFFTFHKPHGHGEGNVKMVFLMNQPKSKFMKVPCHSPTVANSPVFIYDFVAIQIDQMGQFVF